MKGERIRGDALRVSFLCRLAPVRIPSYSRKLTGKFSAQLSESTRFTLALHPSQGERNEPLRKVSVRSSETATLARVLRATDAYSIAWGKFYLSSLFASTTTSRSQSHRLKAAEPNLSVLQEMREGSGVSGGCMVDFELFWKRYPRKVGRMKAEKIWLKMGHSEQAFCIIGVNLWSQTAQWQSAGGIYIPYASTFLAQRRWEDEPWTGAFDGR